MEWLKSLRSVAIELHENIDAIEQWRTTLTDKQRRRLRGPLQNVRRWKRETGQTQSNRTNAVARRRCFPGTTRADKTGFRPETGLCPRDLSR